MSNRSILVLLAHGSSDPDWSSHFVEITQQVREKHEFVRLAYMELSEPSLEDMFKEATLNQLDQVCVLPLFFARGRHLKVDVPKQLAELETLYGIKSELLPPVGEHPSLPDFLAGIIEGSMHDNDLKQT